MRRFFAPGSCPTRRPWYRPPDPWWTPTSTQVPERRRAPVGARRRAEVRTPSALGQLGRERDSPRVALVHGCTAAVPDRQAGVELALHPAIGPLPCPVEPARGGVDVVAGEVAASDIGIIGQIPAVGAGLLERPMLPQSGLEPERVHQIAGVFAVDPLVDVRGDQPPPPVYSKRHAEPL